MAARVRPGSLPSWRLRSAGWASTKMTATRPLSTRTQIASVLNWPCRTPPTSVFKSQQHRYSSKRRSHTPNLESAMMAPSVERARQARMDPVEQASMTVGILFPGTFIRPPLASFPTNPKAFLQYVWAYLKTKAASAVGNALHKFRSKPGFFKRARFNANLKAAVTAAQALHRTLAESLASGDKHTLRKICSVPFAQPLVYSIEARPRGRQYGWELVKYTKPLFYPRVMSHRIAPMPGADKNAPVLRQVVVAISSRQRRVEYDFTPKGAGRVVPGSEKEVEAVEYVALGTLLNPVTWQQDEWKVVGTVKPTTLDGWKKEEQVMARLEREMTQKRV